MKNRSLMKTMRMRFWLTCWILFSLSTVGFAQQRILFVGNSFTYGHMEPAVSYYRDYVHDLNGSDFGGVPGIFKKLSEQAGQDYTVAMEAPPGKSLRYHLKVCSDLLMDQTWDVVVLQENSTRPLPAKHGGKPDTFVAGADGLYDLFTHRNPAVKVFLYETWASPTSAMENHYEGDLQAMQNDLQEAYIHAFNRIERGVGTTNFAGLGRVGDAFMRAIDQNLADPDCSDGVEPGKVFLWDLSDSRHAGAAGSYLAAVVLFARITGVNANTINAGPGTAAADLKIDAEKARALHRVAHEILLQPVPGNTH